MTNPKILHQKGSNLFFPCGHCSETVPLALSGIEERAGIVACPHCQQKYAFNDPNLLRQLHKFEALCCQIHASEEILSTTSVGVDVGPHQIKIPFKLLLTRFNAHLQLRIGEQDLAIIFRSEPTCGPS